MLIYARMYIGKSCELYDCLLGLARNRGTTPEDAKATIERTVRRACSVRIGRQNHNGEPDSAGGGELRLCERTLKNFRAAVRSAVADGGPVEQQALFELSPGALDAASAAYPFFPHLTEIIRDKAHKLRSVQRGAWGGVDTDLRTCLDELVTGEHSLARMLQTSKKYQSVFQARSSCTLPACMHALHRWLVMPRDAASCLRDVRLRWLSHLSAPRIVRPSSKTPQLPGSANWC